MEVILKDTNKIINIKDKVFGHEYREHLVHQVVNSYICNSHQSTKGQKNRSEVSGSNKKPWRQKGTGRARAGSKKSPIWRSGGVTFAHKYNKSKVKINRKMYKLAIKSILSELLRNKRLIFIQEISINIPKTKILLNKLNDINIKNNSLIIVNNKDSNLFLASRNLKKVKIFHVDYINPLILISFHTVIITLHAIKKIEDSLS